MFELTCGCGRRVRDQIILPGLKPAHFHFPLPPLCAGIGYSMFSHGGLSRCLDMKSPPPLNLGGENLRGDPGNQAARVVNHGSAVRSLSPPPPPQTIRPGSLLIFLVLFCADKRGVLYGGLHGGGSMVAMGRAGLLGHSFGGYGFPSAGTPGTSEGESG